MNAQDRDFFSIVQTALAGQYSLERELGRGGMAVVFLAREVELDRLVALKVLPPDRASDPELRDRFQREARIAAGLSHPNIVQIHRVGEADGVVFFSMAYVDGETLGDRLRTRGPLAPSAATRMVREVAQALAYAHGRGIVHRDVKPDNILLERGTERALVTDFGIAAAAHSSDARVSGTPYFMSPEQMSAVPLDGRSDIYSLGVVAFMATTGKLPGERGGISGGNTRIASVAPSLPAQLARAIDRALAANPEKRFQSAEEFADAVELQLSSLRQIPPELRQWLEARDPWMVPYIVWGGTNFFFALNFTLDYIIREVTGSTLLPSVSLGPFGGFGLAVALLAPFVPALIFQSRVTGKALDAGYGIDDLRAAIAQWRKELSDSTSSNAAGKTPRIHGIAQAFAWSSVLLYLFSLVGIGPFRDVTYGYVGRFAFTLLVFGTLPLLSAFGIPLIPKIRWSNPATLKSLFWNSKLGEWAAKYLMRGRTASAPASMFRPTEAVLGTAVEDLFRSLPTAFRQQLSEVPGVIQRLQTHAARARTALERVESANPDMSPDVNSIRELARKELSGSISALERIRLDMLRLIGGDSDLRPSATMLESVKRVNQELERLQSAQREVDRIVRPIALDLRPHSPA